jgi:peptidoglycan/LPS O-acetylase OafA/YrhL
MQSGGGGEPTAAGTGFVSKAPKLGFVPAFDGLRGIGIAMVLYEHALSDTSVGIFSVSPIVDVFFVLSGFLIVTLLLQEHRTKGAIDVREFFKRRGRRLLPSLWLYLATMLLLSAVFLRDQFMEVFKDAAAAFFYVYNLFYPPGNAAFHPLLASNRAMSQLWTLSLEEQFYFLIAGTIVLCVAKRWIKPLIVVCVVGSIFIEICRANLDFGPFLIVMQRPDALLLGTALAAVNAMWGDFTDTARRVLRWVASIALTIGILVMLSSSNLVRTVLGSWAYVESFPAFYSSWVNNDGVREFVDKNLVFEQGRLYFIQYGHTVVIWMTLPVVLAFARVPQWRAGRFLTWRPFLYLGKLSYSLYIWHGLGIIFALALIGHVSSVKQAIVRAVIAWVISFAFAIPVHKYVELRFWKAPEGRMRRKETEPVVRQ